MLLLVSHHHESFTACQQALAPTPPWSCYSWSAGPGPHPPLVMIQLVSRPWPPRPLGHATAGQQALAPTPPRPCYCWSAITLTWASLRQLLLLLLVLLLLLLLPLRGWKHPGPWTQDAERFSVNPSPEPWPLSPSPAPALSPGP